MNAWSADSIRVSITGYAQDRNTSRTLPVRRILDDIKTGKYEKPIVAIREQYQQALADNGGDHRKAKKSVAALKKRLPGVMWGGTFKKRGNANLETYSGLLCADIDDMEPNALDRAFRQLRYDPHAVAVFRSPTGTGIKAVFRVGGDATQHGGSFIAVKRLLKDAYKLDVDPSCSNVERLCFVSFDPAAVFNEGAEPLPTDKEAGEAKHSSAFCILHSASCILHSASCILHPASLHPASLHPASLHPASHQKSILGNIQSRKEGLQTLRVISPGLDELYLEIVEPRFQAAQGERNDLVVNAVTFLYRAIGVSYVLPMVGCLYDANQALFNDAREDHMKEANSHLNAVMKTYENTLPPQEREVYSALPEKERDAFRIARDLAMLPEPKREGGTFFMAYGHLAKRIGVHSQQAKRIMGYLAGYGLVKLLKNGTRRSQGVRGDACTWKWML